MLTKTEANMKKTILFLSSAVLLSACASIEYGNLRLDGETLKAAADVATTFSQSDATPEVEARIGHESASVLLGAAPLIQDKAVLQYVNQLGSWIARQSGRPDINWRFGVLNSPNVNAFAAPDGYIFVTDGLLRQLNNEAELAGVLAHEIAHVVKRHYLIAIRKNDNVGALSNLAATGAKTISAKGVSMSTTPLFNLAKNMYASGLDKSDEYEADRLGVIYATRAGYDPYGLPRVLSMYAANASQEGFALLFSTHPSPQDRLAELNKLMGNKFAAYEQTGLNDSPAFKKMRASSQPAVSSGKAKERSNPAR
jgi:predicted Zn-dependent protease